MMMDLEPLFLLSDVPADLATVAGGAVAIAMATMATAVTALWTQNKGLIGKFDRESELQKTIAALQLQMVADAKSWQAEREGWESRFAALEESYVQERAIRENLEGLIRYGINTESA